MKNLICERCGYEYAPDEGYRALILKRYAEKGADYVEMCRYCYASLLEWSMSGKEDRDGYEARMGRFINGIIRDNGEPNDFGEEQ